MTLEQFLGFLASLIKWGVIGYIVLSIIGLGIFLLFWFVIIPRNERAFNKRVHKRREERGRNKWR